MPNRDVVAAPCVLSGLLGLSRCPQDARAADPATRPQWKCKNVTYWWDGDKTVIEFAFEANGLETTSTGLANIFAAASSFDLPLAAVVPATNYDLYAMTGCVPQCGKDANGVWQSTQEVSPVNLPVELSVAGVAQNTCTYTFPSGSRVPRPVNGNAGGKHFPPTDQPGGEIRP